MKKYDIEIVEQKLLELFKSKLAAKLAEIDADKDDGITLEVPTDAQYYDGTDIDEEVINQTPLIRHGIVTTDTNSISAATAEVNGYLFLILLDGLNEEQGVIRKRLFRYARAFKEIFEENFDAFSFLSNITITTIAPALWRENELSPVYKTSGVYIEAALAS